MLSESDHFQLSMAEVDRKGDSQALLNSASDAVEYARNFEPDRLAQSLSNYARLLIGDEQYDQAHLAAQEVLQIDGKTSNAVEALISLGVCAAQTNRLNDAEQYLNQAAELSRKINYLTGLARALQILANQVLLLRGQFNLAMAMSEEAGAIYDEQENKHWQEPFLRGLIYQIVGDRQHCRQVLDELVMQIEPGTHLAVAYYFLWARLAMDEEELEKAKEYLRLALRVANRIGVLDLNLWIRLEYSRYYRLKNEAPVARTWADDTLHQAQRHHLDYFIGLALLERAQANWDTGDIQEAEADLDEAMRVLTPLCAAYDLTRARFLRALWYRQVDHPQSETAWMEAAHSLIREGDAFILEKEQDLAFPLIAAHMRSKTVEVRSITENLLRHLANVPPPPLRVTTLGQFAVWKGRRRIPDQAWTRRKAGDLFRYLILQPNRAAGRDIIIESLWPDHTSDKPEDLLHQATSALRHALEPDLPDKFPSRYLRVEGERIALILPPGSLVDLEHFERALPLAIQIRNPDRLIEALNMYSGELFPSDRYMDWSAEKRQALSELAQQGMLTLATFYLEQGQFFNAINVCRQVLAIDSWNEDAVLIAMRAYAGMQDVPHALQMFQRLKNTLNKDLNIPPRKDLCDYMETLRNR